MQNPATEAPAFEVIAHRGASAEAPENTLPAVRRALEIGAPAVELDAQLSRDGVVILFHDASLRSKAGIPGRVSDHDAQSLRTADIGRWFDRTHPRCERRHAGTGLATLEEVFSEIGGRTRYHIEVKSRDADLPSAVLALAARFGVRAQTTLTSFHRSQLVRAGELDRLTARCWLLRSARFSISRSHFDCDGAARPFSSILETAAADGVSSLGIPARKLTSELVEQAHARGLRVRAWGVRGESDMARVIASGAAGMTTDWPERALVLLGRMAPSQRGGSRA